MATCVLKPTNSASIQKAFDKTGTSKGVQLQYSDIYFSKGEYLINSRLYLNDNTKILCEKGAILTLADNAPNFGEQVPVIGQKGTFITGIEIEGLTYEGNYAKQSKTPGDHGKGYGNLFGFTNISNSTFKNVTANRNEGDGWRINGGTNLTFSDCSGYDGGHDFIHAYKCSQVKVINCSVELRANSAVRVRSSSNFMIDGCKFQDITNNAWSPAIQIENIESGKNCKSVEIKNCFILSTYGPGIWGIASTPVGTSADVNIHDNIFKQCGMMPAANKISGVGGIVLDGFTDVLIENNVLDECYGYGIGFSHYQGSGNVKGCKATIRKNIIVNTKKALYPGSISGYAIANVLGKDYYTVTASENCFYKNSGNYYGITGKSDIFADPLFVDPAKNDYSLKENSPCKGGTEDVSDAKAYLQISCTSKMDAETLKEEIKTQIVNRETSIVVIEEETEEPEEPIPSTDTIKNAMLQITTTFENSDTKLHYNYAENIGDGRGITFGCIGFCTGTYDGNILIKHYTKLNPNNTLAKYIPALDAIDNGSHNSAGGDGNPSVVGLSGFIQDVKNCDDPLFKKAQMDKLDELYYNPAMSLAEGIGAKYPLTRAFIYDMCVRHGEDGAKSVIRQAGTLQDELTFLKSMFSIREKMLKNEGLGDVDRVDGFRGIIDNINLVTPFTFVAYGDKFTIDGVL